jgi:thiosulfate/3-mercaptopyruvate sulfurtransferase
MSNGLCLLILLGCFGANGQLIETHELSIKQNSGAAITIIEIINLGETRDPALDSRIPQAKYLSLKSLLDPAVGPLVMVPTLSVFKEAMKKLGIKKDGQLVVVYDCKGMKAAAMAWWLLRAFGHTNVQVLNGGLPKWIREGFMSAIGPLPALLDPIRENDLLYQYVYDAGRFWSIADLKAYDAQQWLTAQVVDVRPRSEFDQRNVRSSINVPSDIICRADGSLRSAIELRAIFEGYRVALAPGIKTAAVSANGVEAAEALLALAAVGKENCVLVNGGWQAYVAQQPATPTVLRQEDLCEQTCADTCLDREECACDRRCTADLCYSRCTSVCGAASSCIDDCLHSFCASDYSLLSCVLVCSLLLLFIVLLTKLPTSLKFAHFL